MFQTLFYGIKEPTIVEGLSFLFAILVLHSPNNMMIVKQNTLTLDSVSNTIADATIPPIPDLSDPAAFEAWR
jgi:hypothetical protein